MPLRTRTPLRTPTWAGVRECGVHSTIIFAQKIRDFDQNEIFFEGFGVDKRHFQVPVGTEIDRK